MDESPVADSGSFRDPLSRVLVADERVVRVLSERGAEDLRAALAAPSVASLIAAGDVVGTAWTDAVPAGVDASFVAAVEHPRLPFITYPYEWPFSMLKEAAQLTLGILRGTLEDGITLKDATPYNVQFHGTRPVFIDVGSFERRAETKQVLDRSIGGVKARAADQFEHTTKLLETMR